MPSRLTVVLVSLLLATPAVIFWLRLVIVPARVAILCPEECECDTAGYEVSCYGSSLTAIPSIRLTDVREFGLYASNITSIKRDSFVSLTELEILIVWQCGLRTIDLGAFNGLTNLTQLLISDNEICEIKSGTFQNLKNLKELNLRHNRIHHLDSGVFSGLDNLKYISLSENELRYIHPDIFLGLPNIKTVLLHKNPCLEVPTERNFINSRSLSHLDISHCNITSVSFETFANVSALERLDLRYNNLRTVDINILKALPKLFKMNLDGNRLQCDCQLQEVWRWYEDRNIETGYGECDSPSEVAGMQGGGVLKEGQFLEGSIYFYGDCNITNYGYNVTDATYTDTDTDKDIGTGNDTHTETETDTDTETETDTDMETETATDMELEVNMYTESEDTHTDTQTKTYMDTDIYIETENNTEMGTETTTEMGTETTTEMGTETDTDTETETDTDMEAETDTDTEQNRYVSRLLTEYQVPVYAFPFIFGTTGNVILLVIIICNKDMRTAPNMYILNLGISDIIYLTVLLSDACAHIISDTWIDSDFICTFLPFCRRLSVGLSAYSVAVLSIQRYTVTVNPFHVRIYSPKSWRVTVATICGVWIVAALFAVPSALSKFLCFDFRRSTNIPYYKLVVIFELLVSCVLPLCVIAFTYIMTARHLVESSRSMPEGTKNPQLKTCIVTAKIVVGLTVVFIISYVPYNVFWTYIIYTEEVYNYRRDTDITLLLYDKLQYMYQISTCFLLINSCLNPVALFCTSSPFRQHLKHYLSCFCKTNSPPTDLELARRN